MTVCVQGYFTLLAQLFIHLKRRLLAPSPKQITMRILARLALLVAVFNGAVALLTIPEPGVPLNVSVSSITIAWTQPEPPTTEFRSLSLEMHFSMPLPGEDGAATAWTEPLAANLTISAGEYEWDPTEVREVLESHRNATTERQEAEVIFEAVMRGPSDGGSVQAFSERFSLVGYSGEEESSAVTTAMPAWLLLASGILCAVQM